MEKENDLIVCFDCDCEFRITKNGITSMTSSGLRRFDVAKCPECDHIILVNPGYPIDTSEEIDENNNLQRKRS